jgi:hypothetical protein
MLLSYQDGIALRVGMVKFKLEDWMAAAPVEKLVILG